MLQALTRFVLGVAVMMGATQAIPAMAQDKTILISFPKASYPFFEAVHAWHTCARHGTLLSIDAAHSYC